MAFCRPNSTAYVSRIIAGFAGIGHLLLSNDLKVEVADVQRPVFLQVAKPHRALLHGQALQKLCHHEPSATPLNMSQAGCAAIV